MANKRMLEIDITIYIYIYYIKIFLIKMITSIAKIKIPRNFVTLMSNTQQIELNVK